MPFLKFDDSFYVSQFFILVGFVNVSASVSLDDNFNSMLNTSILG